MGEDVVGVAPFGEGVPVVGAYDEAEGVVGVGARELAEGDVGVGGAGEVELEVAGAEAGEVLHGQGGEAQADGLVEQLMVLLEGVLGTHHQPHLVHEAEVADVACQGRVAQVDGVERAAKYADFHL